MSLLPRIASRRGFSFRRTPRARWLRVRVDESAPDVAVLHQAVPERYPAAPAVAFRRRQARVRHPEHHVGGYRRLLGQQLAHADAGAVQFLAVQTAVRTSQVNELEQAEPGLYALGRPWTEARAAAGVDHDHLARFHFAHEMGTDDVQRRRLGRQDPAVVQLAEAQRPETVRVPYAHQAGPVSEDQREGSVHPRQHIGKNAGQRDGSCRCACGGDVELTSDEFGDQVRVAGHHPREHAHRGRQLLGVGQVAVVADDELAAARLAVHGLGVVPGRGPGGRIAGVANGQVPDQAGQLVVVEDLGDEAHVLHDHHRGAVAHGHPGRFLSPVLEGVKPVEDYGGHVAPGSVDAEDPAGFPWAGVLNRPAH